MAINVVVAPTYLYVRSRAPENDPPIRLAFGKALDRAISQYNYYSMHTTRSLLGKAQRCAMAVLRNELKNMEVEVSGEELKEQARKMWRMLAAWYKSPYVRYLRPKTHVIIMRSGDFIGALYAQPDFEDNVGQFYEVKSFDIEKEPKKHVQVQAGVFSLLGPLFLVYFSEQDGYYTVKQKFVPGDPQILDDVVDFLKSRPEGSETQPLERLLRSFPSRIYVKENDWKRAKKI